MRFKSASPRYGQGNAGSFTLKKGVEKERRGREKGKRRRNECECASEFEVDTYNKRNTERDTVPITEQFNMGSLYTVAAPCTL